MWQISGWGSWNKEDRGREEPRGTSIPGCRLSGRIHPHHTRHARSLEDAFGIGCIDGGRGPVGVPHIFSELTEHKLNH